VDGRRGVVAERTYRLVGADGQPYRSAEPGTLGGNARGKVYGRLDCATALYHVRNGGYVQHRVFFRDAATAVAAGFRPCGSCLRAEHARWRADPEGFRREVMGESERG
jgi:hypothetical protein